METSVVVKDSNTEKEEYARSSWLSWVRFIVILAILFFVFRFAIGFVVIAGDSMNPTLEDGNIVLSSNIFYTVDRSDIVVYRDQHGFNVIKRVIGLPNDRVAIQGGMVLINGELIDEVYMTGISNDMKEVIVPENSYFVVGDNRTPGESLDSRSSNVGPIHKNNIKGEVVLSLFPFSFEINGIRVIWNQLLGIEYLS